MARVITSPEAVNAQWLTEALRQGGCLAQGRVVDVRVTSESSYTSTIARLSVTYSDDAPETAPVRLFLKMSRPDAEQRVVGSAQRRHEVDFHNRVVRYMPDPPVVRCHQAVFCEATGASHLLLDDVFVSHVECASTSPPPMPQAGRAMDAFAEFHAYWWDHPALGDVDGLPSEASVAEHVANAREQFPRFADALGERFSGTLRQLYERALDLLPHLWQRAAAGKAGSGWAGESQCREPAARGTEPRALPGQTRGASPVRCRVCQRRLGATGCPCRR